MEDSRLVVVGPIEPAKEGRGGYKAAFAFELEGVVREHREASAAKEELKGTTFESLVESLSPGQRISFSFAKLGAAGRRAQYVWRVIGEAEGKSEAEARKAANGLWESVFLMLLGQQLYRFRPVADPLRDNSLEWWGEVLPRSVDLSAPGGHLSLGYNTDRSDHRSGVAGMRLPLLDPEPSEQLPVVTILSAWPLDMEVRIEMGVLPLTRERREAMEQLSQALVGQRAKAKMFPGGEALEEPVAEGSILAWKQMLDYCLAHQKAVVVSVRAGATTALPSAMLATVGRALFPHYSFEPVGEATREPSKASRTIVDLRNLVHSDRNLLESLLPEVDAIDELDLPRSFAMPPADIASTGLKLGGVLGQPVCQTAPDRLRHTYILGATGTGKSTLLYNMIMQDIHAGKGVCVIDPHGDLYDDVLRNIPEHRWTDSSDVVLFNPSDFDWPVGLNFFECYGSHPEIERNILVNELMGILGILYDLRETGGPMFELYLRNALMLMLNNPDEEYTLIDVPSVFENGVFREYLKSRCTKREVVSFWNEQAEQTSGDAELSNMGPYITSKLNLFTHNPVLRQILGQSRSTLNFRELMDGEKILLVNLSKGVLSGLDSYLLGMLLIGKIFRAALSRADTPRQERKTWYVYIDEFQNFMTDTVSQMLSEARKYGLSLVLANQHLAQLNDSRVQNGIMNAVLGNVANLLFFRLGVMDAEKLENYTSPYLKKDDLQFLPDHHVVARILNNLSPARPFVFKTHPKAEDAAVDPSEEIIQWNRTFYATPADRVQKEITERQERWYLREELRDSS